VSPEQYAQRLSELLSIYLILTVTLPASASLLDPTIADLLLVPELLHVARDMS